METYTINIKHAKCYLVKVKDFYIAIDAGWPGQINKYLKGLKIHKIKPEKIKYLFVTHFHPDHAGLVENIKKFGTSFVVFSHQIPFVEIMEKMVKDEKSYLSLNKYTNIVININESKAFFEKNNIPAQAIKTIGHSDDSISIVFKDGCAFIGDLYSKDLIMEEDYKSKQSWNELEKLGVRKIYPAHGIIYNL
jgi:glyoxylase-like metal-dependent hydrolase (beta-lactamase superfamily II)